MFIKGVVYKIMGMDKNFARVHCSAPYLQNPGSAPGNKTTYPTTSVDSTPMISSVVTMMFLFFFPNNMHTIIIIKQLTQVCPSLLFINKQVYPLQKKKCTSHVSQAIQVFIDHCCQKRDFMGKHLAGHGTKQLSQIRTVSLTEIGMVGQSVIVSHNSIKIMKQTAWWGQMGISYSMSEAFKYGIHIALDCCQSQTTHVVAYSDTCL